MDSDSEEGELDTILPPPGFELGPWGSHGGQGSAGVSMAESWDVMEPYYTPGSWERVTPRHGSHGGQGSAGVSMAASWDITEPYYSPGPARYNWGSWERVTPHQHGSHGGHGGADNASSTASTPDVDLDWAGHGQGADASSPASPGAVYHDWASFVQAGHNVSSSFVLDLPPATYPARALLRIEEYDYGDDTIVVMEEADDGYLDSGVMMDAAYANGGFGAVPASGESVDALETRKHDGSGGGCVICIEEYEVGEELSVVPCEHKHTFHRSCLEQWLALSRLCPLCRHALPADGGDDDDGRSRTAQAY